MSKNCTEASNSSSPVSQSDDPWSSCIFVLLKGCITLVHEENILKPYLFILFLKVFH